MIAASFERYSILKRQLFEYKNKLAFELIAAVLQ
jgi:hypothetical protein